MINPTIAPEVIHSETPTHTIDMGEMDAESIAFMLSQSRDGFYSNKELAPIREYATNARDSHIEAGIPTNPIEVTLPTLLEPELKIRDFGNGLSESQLEEVYFKYWKSTKRNTNALSGFFGIGSKSAMAYSDIYTIISINNGRKMIYTAHKNGTAKRIYDGPNIHDEPTGIEIIIPIQQKDIEKFITEALNFFKYWDIRPVFHNIEQDRLTAAFAAIDSTPFLFGNGWAVRPSGGKDSDAKAVMGFVPYNIDWKQVANSLSPEINQKINGIFTFLKENLTTLEFANGTLSFTPNRETLQYNEVTMTELSNKLVEIYNSLLNLINEKISGAPNLWEAKIRYNQIFRKELDGFDKSLTYGGNLNTIESLLKNRIHWNGIVISNGLFEGLECWDSEDGKIGNYDNIIGETVMSIYVKDLDKGGVKRTKFSRRSRWARPDGKIICSPRSTIVIQDTDKTSLAKGYAHWLIYKSGKNISQVYVLNMTNAKVKEEFYKHYNFDTVPTSSILQNEILIKSHLKTIRVSRGGDSGEREARTLNCPYVEIKSRRNGSCILNAIWLHEDGNARGLDEGGYYVVYSKNSIIYNGIEIPHENANYFWQAIYDLSVEAGIKIPKVYGIHPKTADSVWFKEAIQDGDWTHISEFVKENADVIPKDGIKKLRSYLSAGQNRLGILTSKSLLPLLVDVSGVAGKYMSEVVEFSKYLGIKDIPTYLNMDDYGSDFTEVKRFMDLNAEMDSRYPLLFKLSIVKDCEELNDRTSKSLADYINLIDVYA